MTLHLTLSTDEQVNDNGQCSKDDLNCKSKQSEIIDEAKYNAYEHRDVTSREDFLIHQELDEIDELKSSRFFKVFRNFKKCIFLTQIVFCLPEIFKLNFKTSF